jgi:hypothetical protein
MALYAFDGTWNEEKTGDDPSYANTNVARFHEAYTKNSKTKDFYVAGIGTRWDLAGKIVGGAFGLGELPRLDEAYDALCSNWITGDSTIDIVGFSRGAATTLDFCRLINDRQIRKPNSDQVIEPNPQIRFLGVWDVVDAFGLGFLGVQEFNFGHCLTLPARNLKYAFHALALDERRPSFLPTRLCGAWEVWFRGVHADIGGGNGNRGLNDITLKWMMSKAIAAGLPLTPSDIAALKPDPAANPQLDFKQGVIKTRVVDATDRRHYTVSARDGYENPPDTCPVEAAQDETTAIAIGQELSVVPPIVRARIAQLTERAVKTAEALGFSLDSAQAVFNLIEHRVVLVKNDADQAKALQSTQQLVEGMVVAAKNRGFMVLNDFFLTEALFNLQPLFPFTD